MYSGITSGRVLNGELLYTKILEVNLFAFANKLTSRIFVDKIFYIFLWRSKDKVQRIKLFNQLNKVG